MNIFNLREYGNIEKVKSDSAEFKKIINRQGFNFINDCIADYVGYHTIDFKLNSHEVKRLKDDIIDDLINAINERF